MMVIDVPEKRDKGSGELAKGLEKSIDEPMRPEAPNESMANPETQDERIDFRKMLGDLKDLAQP